MIVGFLLPEWLIGAVEDLIAKAGGDAFQIFGDPLQFDFWSEQYVDMISHYYEGVQVVPAKFGIAEFEAVADALGDACVF